MKSVKRFLAGFLAVYVIVGIGVNVTYGPPGYSREFLEQYRVETDRYHEIIKSDPYKLWAENPDVNPPDETLQRRIDFVHDFAQNPDFQAEDRRRARYNAITDWFNVIMLTLLIVVLARGPVSTFVAGLVSAERERIESVEIRRSAVARRKSEAERKLELLEGERVKSDKRAVARIREETEKIERSTDEALRQLREESEDRRRHEEILAQRRLEALIADEALALLEKQLRNEDTMDLDAVLLDRFLVELEARRS